MNAQIWQTKIAVQNLAFWKVGLNSVEIYSNFKIFPSWVPKFRKFRSPMNVLNYIPKCFCSLVHSPGTCPCTAWQRRHEPRWSCVRRRTAPRWSRRRRSWSRTAASSGTAGWRRCRSRRWTARWARPRWSSASPGRRTPWSTRPRTPWNRHCKKFSDGISDGSFLKKKNGFFQEEQWWDIKCLTWPLGWASHGTHLQEFEGNPGGRESHVSQSLQNNRKFRNYLCCNVALRLDLLIFPVQPHLAFHNFFTGVFKFLKIRTKISQMIVVF